MSKTDKTNPYWVKLARREWGAKVKHVHHGKWFTGICVVAAPRPIPRRDNDLSVCEIWQSYYSSRFGSKIWERFPRRKVRKLIGFEGKVRGELVKLRRRWRYEDREDIDSSWGAPRRRCQVRDPWHWE